MPFRIRKYIYISLIHVWMECGYMHCGFPYNHSVHLFILILRIRRKLFAKVKPISVKRKLATNDTQIHIQHTYTHTHTHRSEARISQNTDTKICTNHSHKSVFICIHFRLIEIKRVWNITGAHHKILHKIHTHMLASASCAHLRSFSAIFPLVQTLKFWICASH